MIMYKSMQEQVCEMSGEMSRPGNIVFHSRLDQVPIEYIVASGTHHTDERRQKKIIFAC